MAIVYDGTYGIFTKIGLIGGFLESINAFQKSLYYAKSPTFVEKFTLNGKTKLVLNYIPTIESQISLISDLMPNLFLDVAANALIDTVTTHDPLIPKNVTACMNELVSQMLKDNKTVAKLKNTITVSDPSAKNVVVWENKNTKGGPNQFTLAESIRFEVSSDSYTGGASSGNETFSIITKDSVDGAYSYDYPAGSGASDTFGRVNIRGSGSEGNILLNGTFTEPDTTVITAPLSWDSSASKGTKGTNWITTTSGLLITGNATQDVRLQQNVTTYINTNALYSFYFKLNAPVALTTGDFQIDLIDDYGTILASDVNSMLSFSVPLSTLTSTDSVFTGSFVMGSKKSPIVHLRIRSTLESTKTLYVKDMVLSEMHEVYPGGPFVSVLGLPTAPLYKGDRIDNVITKAKDDGTTNGATYTNATFQILFDRLFGTSPSGFTLPNSATPNIPDSLIQ